MKSLPKIEPMELVQQATPFDDADWLFEVKYDGFRSLTYIENGTCKLVSHRRCLPRSDDPLPRRPKVQRFGKRFLGREYTS